MKQARLDCQLGQNGNPVSGSSSWRSCLAGPEKRIAATGELSQDSLVRGLLLYGQRLNAYAFHLARVEWSVFGTLTWRDDARTRDTRASEQLRSGDFHWLIGMTCGRLSLRPRNLAIYRKTEWGLAKRGHCNFLIGRRGTEKTTPLQLANTLQDLWSTGSQAKGRAEV